jgi:hypothetical protein
MTLERRLRALFSAIIKEAQENDGFAERLKESLEIDVKSKPAGADKTTGTGRRAPGLFDPFEAFRQGDLEDRLALLNVEQLKDIIAEHRMDRTTKAMKWKAKERLIPLIVTTVSARSRKGDAFRNQIEKSGHESVETDSNAIQQANED